jgi:hypothetical protein
VRIGGTRRISLPLLAAAGVVVVAVGLGFALVSAPRISNEGVAVAAHVHSNSVDGMHVHEDGQAHHHLGPALEVRLSPTTQRKLDRQLAATRRSVRGIHTAADAMARGYVAVTVDLAYLGVHYVNPEYINKPFDPERPTHLIFNDNSPDAPLIGLMYYVYREGAAPPGFAGPNDLWHVHEHACMAEGFMLALDDVTVEQCATLGGAITQLPPEYRYRWMVHVWAVPGQENPWGLFANGDPVLA